METKNNAACVSFGHIALMKVDDSADEKDWHINCNLNNENVFCCCLPYIM